MSGFEFIEADAPAAATLGGGFQFIDAPVEAVAPEDTPPAIITPSKLGTTPAGAVTGRYLPVSVNPRDSTTGGEGAARFALEVGG